jgi:hypothetical protein
MFDTMFGPNFSQRGLRMRVRLTCTSLDEQTSSSKDREGFGLLNYRFSVKDANKISKKLYNS